MHEFTEALGENTLLLDGGMGSVLLGNGFRGNPCLLNAECPEAVKAVHESYLDAGADIIETNTVNANSLGMQGDVREVNRAGARIAVAAARKFSEGSGRKRYVAGAVGPTSTSATLSPGSFGMLIRVFTEQIAGLAEGGTDFLLLETMFDLRNAEAAAIAAHDVMNLEGREIPLLFSFTASGHSGRIFSGDGPDEIIRRLAPYRPAAVGYNCSSGPAQLIETIRHLRDSSPYPVIFYPNAGMPDVDGNYSIGAQEFAETVRPLVAEGAVDIIGGCCGTTPAHIAALRRILDAKG